jgi:hypothetical protein
LVFGDLSPPSCVSQNGKVLVVADLTDGGDRWDKLPEEFPQRFFPLLIELRYLAHPGSYLSLFLYRRPGYSARLLQHFRPKTQ